VLRQYRLQLSDAGRVLQDGRVRRRESPGPGADRRAAARTRVIRLIDSADPGVRWLLESDEPAVRRLALTDVLGRPVDDPPVLAEQAQFAHGPIPPQLPTQPTPPAHPKQHRP